jgi:6-phosphogluconolactonase (cycloisomerase 2 family)
MDPRSLTLDATGQFLYVGNTASNDISGYAIDMLTGILTPVPGSPFPAGAVPLGLAADPSGRFLYVSDSVSKDVTVFSIDDDTGSLVRIQSVPTAGNATSIVIKAAVKHDAD